MSIPTGANVVFSQCKCPHINWSGPDSAAILDNNKQTSDALSYAGHDELCHKCAGAYLNTNGERIDKWEKGMKSVLKKS